MQAAAVLEKGAPLTLLIGAYGEWIPVVIPLLVIQVAILSGSTDFNLFCAGKSPLVKCACIWTQDAVKWFGAIGLTLRFSLLTWRLLHERAYYALLQHRILIDLDN